MFSLRVNVHNAMVTLTREDFDKLVLNVTKRGSEEIFKDSKEIQARAKK